MRAAATIDRRQFLKRTARRPKSIALSCERLYMKYADARSEGRLPQFLADLERHLAGADEVRLSGSEWLSRDDFRTDVEPLLRTARG